MNRFENGQDSYRRAMKIFLLVQNDGKEIEKIEGVEAEFILKDFVLSFHHAIEVLFKDILCDEFRLLNAENIDAAIGKQYDHLLKRRDSNEWEPDRTSMFMETIKRMTVLFRLPVDAFLDERFRRLNDIRNSIMHDRIDLIKERAGSIVMDLFPHVTWILETCLSAKKREMFEEYISDVKPEHAKWRIGILLSLFRFQKDNQQTIGVGNNKILLAAFGGDPTIPSDDCGDKNPIEWIENQFTWTLAQMDDTSIKEIRERIVKTREAEPALRNFICRFLRRVPELFEKADGNMEDMSEEDRLYILMALEEIRPVIFVEALLYHKNGYEDARKTISLNDGTYNLNDIWVEVAKWKKEHQWYHASKGGMEQFIQAYPTETDILHDVWESYDMLHYADEVIQETDDMFEDLLGELSDVGTIDRIDEATVEDVIAMTCDDADCREYTIFLQVKLDTECYYDHEFFSNGFMELCVAMTGQMGEKGFEKREVRRIGKIPEFALTRGILLGRAKRRSPFCKAKL